jgi:hypothetical protein
VQGTDTERSDPEPFDVHRVLELGRLQPAGEQQPDCAVEASQREGECARRRGVEPLDVVDRHDDRLPLAHQAEHIAYGRRERARVGGLVRRVIPQQRDLERPSPRRGQLADHPVEDSIEQIPEPDVREPPLGLGRPCRQHDPPAPARRRDSREPHRRLPDPGLALENQRHRLLGGAVEEAVDGAELPVAADDLDYAHATIVTAPRAQVSTAHPRSAPGSTDSPPADAVDVRL